MSQVVDADEKLHCKYHHKNTEKERLQASFEAQYFWLRPKKSDSKCDRGKE
jgi:hypothetical protein